VVLEHQRDVVAGLQAERAEQLRHLIGAVFQFAVGLHLAGAGHDHGGLVGRGAGVMGRMQHRVS
jgi:hypothetical protein